jgi:hypothetical protein
MSLNLAYEKRITFLLVSVKLMEIVSSSNCSHNAASFAVSDIFTSGQLATHDSYTRDTLGCHPGT